MSLVFLLTLLTLSASIQVNHAEIMKTLIERWGMYRDECNHNISRAPFPTGLVCNRTFDRYACWPDGVPNSTVSVACPWYLPWHQKVQHGFVYRECDWSGQWVALKNTSECMQDDPDQEQYGRSLSSIKATYTVGYSLSLGALVLALGILVAFRKLHCMRNNIHMNLFASFILRALSILIKDALATPSLSVIPDIAHEYEVEQLGSNKTAIGCRVTMVLMHYGIMANNYWLLVEGIYLHNLLVVIVFNEKNYFHLYLCIGWGTPLIFLLPWVTMKYLYENEGCWEQNISMTYWWIIRIPILLVVLINFFIFMRVIKILMSKLRAHQMRYTDYKFRLAKSTLTLIPLLGIHCILFAFATDEQVPPGSLRLTKLFCDLLLDSFQGLLVAILYCFVNKEVQSELLKKWKRWKLGKDIDEEYRHTHSQMAHMKSSSMAMHLQLHPLDHLHPAPLLAPPSCSREEHHHLMPHCQNGTGKGSLLFADLPHDGDSSCSTLMETLSLDNRSQSIESNL